MVQKSTKNDKQNEQLQIQCDSVAHFLLIIIGVMLFIWVLAAVYLYHFHSEGLSCKYSC